MAIAVGNTVYWTSGGVTYSGTVLQTPTVLQTSGLPNQDGGEPFYVVDAVSPSIGGKVTSTTPIPVRQSEVRLNP